MATGMNQPDPKRQAELRSALQHDREQREKSYRGQALKLLPHVCGRCGREFSGKRLRELTVHHRDHNHKNNPPDGSNWELLCLYCHDHEHEKHRMAGFGGGGDRGFEPAPSVFSQFEGLDRLISPPPSAAGSATPDVPKPGESSN